MPTKFSQRFKDQAVQKAIASEGRLRLEELAKELNISYSTLQRWVREYKQPGDHSMPNSTDRRPADWTAYERLEALLATSQMDTEACNIYCREQGLYPEHLEQWKQDISQMETSQSKPSSQAIKALKKEVKALQKELMRKDRALAETTAILVLKKKLATLYGEDEAQ